MFADLSANASFLPAVANTRLGSTWERLRGLWSQSMTVQSSFASWDLCDEVVTYRGQELGKRT